MIRRLGFFRAAKDTKQGEPAAVRELTVLEQEHVGGAKPKPRGLGIFQRTGRWD